MQDLEEHLEVVLLLVGDDVDEAVEGPVVVPVDGHADVLGDVDGRAVLAQEDLLVEADRRQVDAHRAVLCLEEDAGGEALLHLFLARQVYLALVIVVVEGYARALVGLA